jgi:aryl-alcohol dehydrogenase-like predicted oxidoreductase
MSGRHLNPLKALVMAELRYRVHRGESLSEIGVGCYALSGVYGRKDPAEFQRMIQRAYELGVNYFDTAAAYGDAEQLLGAAIAPFRPEIFLATKIAASDDGTASLTRAAVYRSCEQSLARLQTEVIDLLLVHFDDSQTPVAETVTALDELVQAGKIRHYGLSHLPQERVAAYLQTGNIFAVMMELSAVARESTAHLLPLCRQYGAAGIAFSVTGRGLLTGRFQQEVAFNPGDIRRLDPLFQRERLVSARRVASKLAGLGERYGKTPAQTAVAWTLAQPGIVCALTGPSTVAHLEENVGGSGWSLAAADQDELKQLLRDEDAWLAGAQRQSVKHILTTPLPADPQQAFVDLVYAVETAVLLAIVTETDIMPLFQELFSLRRTLDDNALLQLTTIQQKLQVVVDRESD